MKPRPLACALVLVFAGLAAGQAPPPPNPPPPVVPVASIVGPPGPVPAGGGVVLDGSKSTTGQDLVWSFDPPVPFFSIDKPPQRFAFLAYPPPGDYIATAMALGLAADGKPIGSVVTVRFTVGPATPPPTPVPPGPSPVVPPITPPLPIPPGPDPESPEAADPYGFASIVASRYATTGWTPAQGRAAARALAAVFASQADAAGSQPSAQAMLNATAVAAKAAMGPGAFAQWRDLVIAPIKDQVVAANSAGKLLTAAELAQAYRTIAAALRRI